MPPKKFTLTSAKDNVGLVPQWRFRNDAKAAETDMAGWTPYSPAQNELIEVAFLKGLKTADIGQYFVDTKNRVQTHVKDPLKSRKIKRFLMHPEEAAAVAIQVGAATTSVPPRSTTVGAPLLLSSTLECPPLKKPRVEGGLSAGGGVCVVEISEGDDSTMPAAPPAAPSPVVQEEVCESVTPHLSSSTILKRIPSKDIQFKSRPHATTQPHIFLPTYLDATAYHAITAVFANAPTINRKPLDYASVLIEPTRRWLRTLGRPEKERGVFITLPESVMNLPDMKRIPVSESAILLAREAKVLSGSAKITYVGKKPEQLLLANESQAQHASLSYKDHLKTQQLVVSGWVRILYDGCYKPLAQPPAVVMCSVPGINFAYSKIDQHYFSKSSDADDDGQKTVLDKDKVLTRMRLIWQHVLLVMDEHFHVAYPVLCAIGCGAFKGVYGALVPRLWATALAQVVCNSVKVFKHIKAIFLSLPTFGKDNNFAPFEHSINEVLKDHVDVPYPPIVLMEDASMIDIALCITQHVRGAEAAAAVQPSTQQPPIVGILNPSDVQAIRHGWLGMYWDGGHIALEEVLAMQTTLLLQHVGLNKSLFTDPKRLIGVKKIIPDMVEE